MTSKTTTAKKPAAKRTKAPAKPKAAVVVVQSTDKDMVAKGKEAKRHFDTWKAAEARFPGLDKAATEAKEAAQACKAERDKARRECGKLLDQAKKSLKRGAWGSWLEVAGIPRSTADRMIKDLDADAAKARRKQDKDRKAAERAKAADSSSDKPASEQTETVSPITAKPIMHIAMDPETEHLRGEVMEWLKAASPAQVKAVHAWAIKGDNLPTKHPATTKGTEAPRPHADA